MSQSTIGVTAIEKLRRFCYLGTVEAPVYVVTSFDVTVECHFEAVHKLCAEISDEQLLDCLKCLLDADDAEHLPRHDEAILVLAIYLSSHVDEQQRTLVREKFVELVRSDKDLLLFTNYVKRVQSLLKRKTPFGRTVRKAVLDWYKKQPLDKLLHMWSLSDCDRATHRDLLYRCHYRDAKFDAEIMAALRLMSTPSKELVAWPSYLNDVASSRDTIVGIAQLRLAQNAKAALPIVRAMSLSYEHVPRYVMKDAKLVKLLLPKMSYEQLLLTWPSFLSLFKRPRSAQRNYIELFFDEAKLRAANVAPLRLLLQETRATRTKKMITKGVVAANKPSFMLRLYKRSFGLNKALGLRLHITLNLEACYLGKSLTGRWRSIKYLDAMMAIAFAYYKSDPAVKVSYWHDASGQLESLPWTPAMSVDEAKACCENQKVAKVKQTLTGIIDSALADAAHTYDVFLVLAPSGTRGNPKKCSNQLCLLLDEYRRKRNAQAKFILVSLRQNHASMSYSTLRAENILELCSLSEQTALLINAFAHGKFI